MTDDDIKLASELAKAATDSALEPIKEQVTNLFSPLTKEVGLLFALPAQLLRFKAKVIIAEKAMKFLNERGVKPQQVPIKLLSPVLEYGCLEDDGKSSRSQPPLPPPAVPRQLSLPIIYWRLHS
jgi:hypothetical protein